MKQYIFTALFCVLTLCAQAQKITRDYQNESLSKVLEDLNAATSDKTIYFIYDELEDFTVTSHFTDLPIHEAIREVIGFYPMKVTYDEDKIFIECTQKEDTKVIGHIVDESGQPIEFANISLLTPPLINPSMYNEMLANSMGCPLSSTIWPITFVSSFWVHSMKTLSLS